MRLSKTRGKVNEPTNESGGNRRRTVESKAQKVWSRVNFTDLTEELSLSGLHLSGGRTARVRNHDIYFRSILEIQSQFFMTPSYLIPPCPRKRR